MKRYIFLIFPSILGLLFNSCTDWFDINVNPDASTTVTAELSLPVVIFYASQINYDHAEYGVYLSQALTTGGRSQTGATAYKSGWEFLTMNRHPQWRRHFYDIGINGNELRKAAEREHSPNFSLIARTIQLMSLQLTTDDFGDMPRSEAYTGKTPKYDTQESIYEWMLQEADNLIADYDNKAITECPTNKVITPKMDRIFEGDLKKWKNFTMGLKARILLRKLPNWQNTQESCQEIINAVDKALDGWAEPRYNYPGGTSEENCPWGSAQPKINVWESRDNLLNKAIPSEFLCVNMLGIKTKTNVISGSADDPRLDVLMTPRKGIENTADAGLKYRYLKNNIGMDASYKEEKNYPDLYTCVLTQNNGYIPLMMTEELYFIRAEAEYWSGDKQKAYETTKIAVRMNMDRLAPDGTNGKMILTPNSYERVCTKFFTDSKLTAKYLPENDFNIGHLMRQKYIAMMFQPEQWTDMRRYNYSNSHNQYLYDGVIIYPGLRRPYNLYEPYWMSSDNKEEWIQRLNYDPESEEKYNVAELKRLGAYKNPEWLKKPMIWGGYDGQHK